MKSLNSFFAILFIATAIASPASSAKPELIDPLPKKYSTPEIAGIEKWFNSKPLKISSLKDKVVLIDFWTYSCVNCLRTLPHINELHEKYADKGLVIIGIHAPEFDFEKNQKNVEMAIKRFGIKYPVGSDNELKTWRNFKNHYWPAHYLIDKKGRIVYAHFGEGKYDVMDNNVVALLGIDLNKSEKVAVKNIYNHKITPETYLGSARRKNYSTLSPLPANGWSVQGGWKTFSQFIESEKSGSSLQLNFTAKKVFLVMANASKKPARVTITLNGKTISGGGDVKNGSVIVTESRLYELLDLPKTTTGLLEIKTDGAGLQAYSFTFAGE